jgi:hypothetical protein
VLIAGLLLLFLIAGPLLFAAYGLHRMKSRAVSGELCPFEWRRCVASTLLYALAFSVTFFIQELFLVVPKALTPGLHPRLFHNNHTWTGDNPLAALWQGTGAVATVLSGLVCLWLLRQRPGVQVPGLRLWLIWMAYCGFFMALPQVVVGALSPASDVGMAMRYLHMSAAARTACALIALACIPALAWRICGEFLRTANPRQIAAVRQRMRFILYVATVPALLALPLIVLFRIPRDLVEVVVVPLAVTVCGIPWVQSSAWRGFAEPGQPLGAPSLAGPSAALLALLLLFQLLLRRGIG